MVQKGTTDAYACHRETLTSGRRSALHLENKQEVSRSSSSKVKELVPSNSQTHNYHFHQMCVLMPVWVFLILKSLIELFILEPVFPECSQNWFCQVGLELSTLSSCQTPLCNVHGTFYLAIAGCHDFMLQKTKYRV